MDSYAFYDCNLLKSAYFEGDVPTTWGTKVFTPDVADFIIYYVSGSYGWKKPTWTAADKTVYRTALFTPENSVEGDVDRDGDSDQNDLKLLQKYFAGWKVTLVDPDSADLNGDGELTRADVMKLARRLAGWYD